jgi:hypothetical protein
LADILREAGPSLSTELIEEMVAKGASSSAARQRIVRGLAAPSFDIVRLAGLRFQHNARFLYLRDQFGGREFWLALERAFRKSGVSYWRAITGMKARGGYVPLTLFATVSGAPTARKGQLSPQRILERLSAIQLLTTVADDNGHEYVRFLPNVYQTDPPATVRARLLAEQVALEGVKEWVRRLGFGSFDQVRVRNVDLPPEVASVRWDLSAPSYIRPLVALSATGPKPGFIVADIILRGLVDEDMVAAFVSKHDLATAPAGIAPVMPFVVADGFTNDAFRLARSKGIVAATTRMLLGDEIARALGELIDILTNLGATAAVNPGHLEHVLNTLTRIEGTASNVRGALFELAIGYLVKEIEGGYMKAGERVRDPSTGSPAEIDVLLDRPDDKPVLVVECKAKAPGSLVSLADVQRWRQNRIPVILEALRADQRFTNRAIEFGLWSNGRFHPAALAWLQAQPTLTQPHRFDWKGYEELLEYTRSAKSAVISKIMNDHYFRHPLVDLPQRQTAAESGEGVDGGETSTGIARISPAWSRE